MIAAVDFTKKSAAVLNMEEISTALGGVAVLRKQLKALFHGITIG